MERALAVLVDADPGFDQVWVQRPRRVKGQRRVRFALDQQRHAYAAPRGMAQVAEEAVAGEEVSVGDHHLTPGRADRAPVFVLDAGAAPRVVADQQHRLGIARGIAGGGRRWPPVAPRAVRSERRQGEAADVGDDRPFQFDRVVLLRCRPEVGEVVGGEVDAPDEGARAVDHQQLAVEAAEHVGTDAEQGRLLVVGAEAHPGVGQRSEESVGERRRAVAVDGQFDPHAAARGLDQPPVQFVADLVLEQDEGLDEDFRPRFADGGERAGEELLAVLQQLDAVAGTPCAFGRARVGQSPAAAVAHRSAPDSSRMPASNGAWSDRCDHGCAFSTVGSIARALRR